MTEPDKKTDRFLPRAAGPRKFHVIINPAAGKDQPILRVMNATFNQADIDWDVFITKEAGDGRRLAQQAVQDSTEAVVVHGGDGTVMDVASGLIGSHVPMAILPGGTANVMSQELNIPLDLAEACTLAANPEAVIRKVDMGQLGDRHFMLRAGMGFEAAMVENADREMKDRLGLFAYTLSALQALSDPVIARYRLVMDEKEVETEGMTCIIANSGNVGRPGITMAPGIDVSDGLLDVLVVTKADLPSLVAMAASLVTGSEIARTVQHWQSRQVTVYAEPQQMVQADGEMIGETPVTARVIPDAVRVIVPPVVESH